jgi:peptide/nickel transport system permease protein
MLGLVVRRLAQAVPSLLIVSFLGFLLLSLAPGDPLTSRLDRDALIRMSPEQIADARRALGLDDSVVVQYWHWLRDLAHGNLGYSIVTGRPAIDEIASRLGATLVLLIAALFVALVVGIPFGVLAARKANGLLDRCLTGASVFMISTPTFIIGLVLIYIFAIRLGVLPAGGIRVPGEPSTPGMIARHAVLPALVLGLANAAPLARFTRAGMLEVLSKDFIRMARAKGVPERTILLRHALRNAALPLITLIALLVPDLIAGAVITEVVFAWPGMGRLVVSSAQTGDPAVMMAIVLLVSVTVVLANLAADILYAAADPRVRVA